MLQLGSAHAKKRTLIKLEGTLAGRPAIGLLDSGASGNFVSSSFIKDNGLSVESVDGDRLRVTLADGSQQQARGMLKDADLIVDTYKDRVSYVALPLSGYDFILGMPWLEANQPNINWRDKSVAFEHQGSKHVLHSIGSYQFMSAAELKRAVRKKEVTSISVLQWDKDHLELTITDSQSQSHTLAFASSGVDPNPEQTSARASTLKEFRDVFPDDLPEGLPPRRDIDHKIELVPGSAPTNRPTYRMSPTELDELKKQLDELSQGRFHPTE